ncbi:MAG TPA: PepSY-associated TM helix domain-containing protein, partial [Steroidobacter sp.]|nr:PepSY-associated TM helix domain-containing protein [Steroidobacter sp.]
GGGGAANAQSRGEGSGGRSRKAEIVATPLADVTPMLAYANEQWPTGVAVIRVTNPGKSNARIELQRNGGTSLIDRGAAARMQFDGVSGALLDAPPAREISGTSAVYNVLTSLHLIRFAGPALRWVMFISGVLGTLMAATGLVLWVVKRLPAGRPAEHFGHRLVESLNVGTIAGLPLATAACFWANRLLPVALAERGTWEIRAFFIAWAICLIHPWLVAHRRAWRQQLAACAVLLALLPVYSFFDGGANLLSNLVNGRWLLAAADITILAFALLLAVAWRRLGQQQQPTRARSRAYIAPQTSQQSS